jgi:hypothetical protein
MAEQAQEFNLRLTLDELNTVFGILVEGPFKVVNPLIQKIQAQYNEQAAPAVVAPPAEEEINPKK